MHEERSTLGRTAPEPTATASLYGAPSRWRLQVLDTILRAVALLGGLALVVTTPVLFADGQVALGLAYWAALVICVLVAWCRELGYAPRLAVLLALFFVTGLGVALGEHRVPEFAVYMGAVPLLAALLGGVRWGSLSLALCAATMLVVARLAVTGELPPAPASATALDHPGNWITLGANWALVTAVVGASVWFLVDRLEGSLEEARVLARDLQRQIEAREQTEQQLLQAQKMEAMGQLAGGIAHDFNNLLTIIKFGTTDALESELTPDARASLAMVRDSAGQAEQMVRQLLTLSRRDMARPERLEINEIIERLVSVTRRLMPASVRIETELDPAAGCVWIDEVQLRQVLLNLLLNARDAMPAGGRITVRSVPRRGPDDQDQLCIEVEDEGSGVPPELRDRIFEPFVTTKPPGKGTGLGLSTTRHIIGEAGGSVELDDATGGGALFRLCLPRKPGRVVKLERPPNTPLKGHRIMVVDDEVAIRGIIEESLRTLGVEVTAHPSVEAVRAEPGALASVDLLVTDVVLGGASGLELTAWAWTVRPDLPVIYCSGFVPDDRVQRQVAEGRAAFLQKPFSRETLVEAVGLRLSSARQAQQA